MQTPRNEKAEVRGVIHSTPKIRLLTGERHRERAISAIEQAAHAHRAAAVSHGKGDHLTGHEHSKQAMEHANKAFGWSKDAHQESEIAVKKNP
jgi:hypothetical protein